MKSIFFLFNSKHACTKIASELNFDIETFKLADEVTTIKQYKKFKFKFNYLKYFKYDSVTVCNNIFFFIIFGIIFY